MPLRILVVSARTDIEDVLLDDPGRDSYRLERRPPHLIDPAECARDFPIVLIDTETTPDGITLGRALRAANRAIEFVPIVAPDAERIGVEAIKFGAFDYLLWPPPEASDLWTLVARCLRKIAPPEPSPFPRAFGKYRLLRKLGEGGMAEIFLAEQPATATTSAREVVIKRLHDNLAAGEEFVKMFMDESSIASRLIHPNIVRVFDHGKVEEAYYLAMEYVPGRNLEELRRDVGGPLPPALAAYMVAEVCAALGHAHAKVDKAGVPMGIVHRDVNPPNVLIADDGRVMLTDFGIAKAAHRYYETTSGVLKGKFEYMAPEQASAQSVDKRADLFCVGLVLYELLSGSRPFLAATPIETLFLIQKCVVEPPSKVNPRLPGVLDKIVMMALQKDPEARYQDAGELERHLREFARRTTNPGPRDISMFAKNASRQAMLSDAEQTSSLEGERSDAPAPGASPATERTESREGPTPITPPAFADTSPTPPATRAPMTVSRTPPGVRPAPLPAGLKAAVPAPAAGPERDSSYVNLRKLIVDDITHTGSSGEMKALAPERAPSRATAPPRGLLALPEIAEPPPRENNESTVIRSLAEIEARKASAGPIPEAPPSGGTVFEVRKPAPSVTGGELFPSDAKAASANRRRAILGASGLLGALLLVAAAWGLHAGMSGGAAATPTPAALAMPSFPSLPSVGPSVAPTAALAVEATPRVVPSAAPTQVAIRPTARPSATPTMGGLASIPTIAIPAPTPAVAVRPAGKGGLSVWVDGWANVFVDGVKTASPAPFADVPFPSGKHHVTLENGARARREFDVVIVPGKSTVIDGTFK